MLGLPGKMDERLERAEARLENIESSLKAILDVLKKIESNTQSSRSAGF